MTVDPDSIPAGHTLTLSTGSAWALRSFGDVDENTCVDTPRILTYVLPERADITGVRKYRATTPGFLRLDLIALVPVDAEGGLVDSGRAAVPVVVVRLGQTIPEFRDGRSGPRLLGPHPFLRDTWVYFGGSMSLLGGAKVHDERMHMRAAR